jgi:hypothetical protein
MQSKSNIVSLLAFVLDSHRWCERRSFSDVYKHHGFIDLDSILVVAVTGWCIVISLNGTVQDGSVVVVV